MITNPIIPVWLMSIICIGLIVLIIYNKQLKEKISSGEKTPRQKKLLKNYIVNVGIKISIIILLFIINLRFMVPNGETTAMKSDLSILFVIDKSVSMRALDYNGNKERIEGVIKDCSKIVEELPDCKYSLITFGDKAKKVFPFTSDSTMMLTELESITLEDDYVAKGTSLNIVKDLLQKTLKEEYERQNGNAKIVVFFVSDGEITKDKETLENFSGMGKYVTNGAVMGYGTTVGGKMISQFSDLEEGRIYYLEYDDENNNRVEAISKIDEKNLKQVAEDLKIDYIQMSKTSNIDYKINDIKGIISSSQTKEQKISSYADIYYYFAIPLAVLLVIDFIIRKKKLV